MPAEEATATKIQEPIFICMIDMATGLDIIKKLQMATKFMIKTEQDKVIQLKNMMAQFPDTADMANILEDMVNKSTVSHFCYLALLKQEGF